MTKRDRMYNPHRRLAAAVVADAVRELSLTQKRDRELRETANAWLWTEKAAGWMELLGYNPTAMRERLVQQGRLKTLDPS